MNLLKIMCKNKSFCLMLGIVLVLFSPACSFAQGYLAPAGKALKSAVQKKSAGAVLSPGASKMHALREHPLFGPVAAAQPEKLFVNFPQMEDFQKKALKARYSQFMKDFTAFKKEMDIRLFYQTLPGEARPFVPVEKEKIFKEIGELHFRARVLKEWIFRWEPSLDKALAYLNEAAGRVDPTFTNMFGSKIQPHRNRVFNQDEFSLRDPKGFSWVPPAQAGRGALFAFSRSKKIMEKLPVRKVALLNDEEEFLDIVEKWASRGGFGSQAQWSFYKDVRSFQQALRRGETFDLVLTDVLIPGGGGLLIAAELRSREMKIPVIALTQYKDTPKAASFLYSSGFDGMIHIDAYFGSWKGDMLFLAQKIQNYFYYRDLHHWAY